MPNLELSLDELKIFAKIKGIRGYESMSEERLINFIDESVKESENNFDGTRIKKVKNDFNKLRDRLSKTKVKVIRKDLYKKKKKKIGEIDKSILKLEKSLSKMKNYHDYDDIEYKGCKKFKDVKM